MKEYEKSNLVNGLDYKRGGKFFDTIWYMIILFVSLILGIYSLFQLFNL